MLDLIQLVPPKFWIIAVLALLGVGWPFKDKLLPMLGSVGGLFAGSGKPDRKAALSSLDDAIAYLESIGCREGVDALKQAYPHFYHQHESAP